MSGTNDKNSLLEVIFYAGFVVSIVSHFESLCAKEKERDREGERKKERKGEKR